MSYAESHKSERLFIGLSVSCTNISIVSANIHRRLVCGPLSTYPSVSWPDDDCSIEFNRKVVTGAISYAPGLARWLIGTIHPGLATATVTVTTCCLSMDDNTYRGVCGSLENSSRTTKVIKLDPNFLLAPYQPRTSAQHLSSIDEGHIGRKQNATSVTSYYAMFSNRQFNSAAWTRRWSE